MGGSSMATVGCAWVVSSLRSRERLCRLLRVVGCFLIAAMQPSYAVGQCTADRCSPAVTPHPAVVRVVQIAASGSRCYGSGTLVHKDDRQGIVLSCAHLFRDEAGSVAVTFPGGRPLEAELVAIDPAWDLAALRIAAPQANPVTVAVDHPKPGDRLQSCGYGSDGRYWCNQGSTLGYARTATTATYETLELTGRARDGDSGGPVFNERGELAAVLWGTDGRIVGGTYCGRIRKFLLRIISLGHLPRQETETVPVLPAPSPGRPAEPGRDDPLENIREKLDGLSGQLDDAREQQAQGERSWSQRIEKLEGAVSLIAGLRGRVERAEQTVGGDNLRAMVREVAGGVLADRGPSLLQKILPGVLAALGWTGPPSIAAIVALRLVTSIVRRRVKKRRQPAARDAGSSSKRRKTLNDDYAEQLAGVYALSGHSSVADATLGREYDEELRRAEQSSDASLARWARTLRERVARRFYRIHDHSPTPAEPSEGGG